MDCCSTYLFCRTFSLSLIRTIIYYFSPLVLKYLPNHNDTFTYRFSLLENSVSSYILTVFINLGSACSLFGQVVFGITLVLCSFASTPANFFKLPVNVRHACHHPNAPPVHSKNVSTIQKLKIQFLQHSIGGVFLTSS